MIDNKRTKIYLSYIGLIGLMDIELWSFEDLKPLKQRLLLRLGWIEASINYFNQKHLKTNVEAQTQIVTLKEERKRTNKLVDEINKRVKRGW